MDKHNTCIKIVPFSFICSTRPTRESKQTTLDLYRAPMTSTTASSSSSSSSSKPKATPPAPLPHSSSRSPAVSTSTAAAAAAQQKSSPGPGVVPEPRPLLQLPPPVNQDPAAEEMRVAISAAATAMTNKEVEKTTTTPKPKPGNRRGTRHDRAAGAYEIYLYKVLQQVHPGMQMSRTAMQVMNSFVEDIFQRIATEAGNLTRYGRKRTLTSREIQTATRLLLPGELMRHAVGEGSKAVLTYATRSRVREGRDETKPQSPTPQP